MPDLLTASREENLADRLDSLLQQKPQLAEAIAFYRGALPALRVAGSAVVPFQFDVEAARRKLAAGVPALAGEALHFDPPMLLALFSMLCLAVEAAVEDDGGPGEANLSLAEAAAEVRAAAEADELDLRALVASVAAGEGERVEEAAARLGLDCGLLLMLLQNTLKPTLRAWAAALAESVDLARWGQGTCPVCGSSPALAEIRGLEGETFLRCGMCCAAWPYPQRQCAFCGNRDSERLHYFAVRDTSEKYVVQGCDDCQGYLKSVVTASHLPADFVLTEDLASLELDVLASEEGYTRNPLTPFTSCTT